MIIKFFFLKVITLKKRACLKQFIKDFFDKEGVKLFSLTYIFCSDKYLLQLNKEFLNHDYYTDILTFDLSSKKRGKEGEVYISIDRIKDNAKKFNINFERELHRVIFHGMLHLCNYQDKSLKETQKMRNAEEKLLKLYFS